MKEPNMLSPKKTAVILGLLLQFLLSIAGAADKTYVGSKACSECHEAEYGRFVKFAKKSHSFRSIEKLQDGLTLEELRQCYGCHTTGYGKPGGFVSVDKTPELMNAGCEVCHGPGSVHVESGDPDDIEARLDIKDCMVCHTAERVAAFSFKPLIHSGAH